MRAWPRHSAPFPADPAQTSAPCSAGVATDQGDYPAEFVVLAAGLGAPALAEPLGAEVPLTHKPGTVNILTPPSKQLLSRILVTGGALQLLRYHTEMSACCSCSSVHRDKSGWVC